MTTPTLEDAEQAIRRARENLDLAAAAADDAVRADRWKQAALALGHASRIVAALAGAIVPPAPPGPGAVGISYGAPGHPKVFAPGPR